MGVNNCNNFITKYLFFKLLNYHVELFTHY